MTLNFDPGSEKIPTVKSALYYEVKLMDRREALLKNMNVSCLPEKIFFNVGLQKSDFQLSFYALLVSVQRLTQTNAKTNCLKS